MTSRKRLVDLVKPHLPELKGVISDQEMIALNRRDFMYSETSLTSEVLSMYQSSSATYEMHCLMDLMQAYLFNTTKQKTICIYQFTPSLTLLSLFCFLLTKNKKSTFRCYAPNKVNNVQSRDDFALEIYKSFQQTITREYKGPVNSEDEVSIVLCNASSEMDINTAITLFKGVYTGLLVIKGYGRLNAPNCGEVLLREGIHVHTNISGCAVGFKY